MAQLASSSLVSPIMVPYHHPQINSVLINRYEKKQQQHTFQEELIP